MTTHLTDDERKNPFLTSFFDIDDLALIMESINLYISNDSRLNYNPQEVIRISKIENYEEKLKQMAQLKPKFEDLPLSDEVLDRLEIIEEHVLLAMSAKEAEDEIGAVIYSIEAHIREQ